jgi:hypothetical protein
MALRLADDVTTRRVARANEDEIPRSEVLVGNHPSGRIVSGAVLEAAVRWNDRYLLFVTDDVPDEDTLGIHLLDGRLNPLDTARIGGPYTTGSFSGLVLEDPSTVQFRFIGDATWRVELLERPAFCFPLVPDSPGVFRPFGFRRHFRVRGQPRHAVGAR